MEVADSKAKAKLSIVLFIFLFIQVGLFEPFLFKLFYLK